jgi:hypothetical protein
MLNVEYNKVHQAMTDEKSESGWEQENNHLAIMGYSEYAILRVNTNSSHGVIAQNNLT